MITSPIIHDRHIVKNYFENMVFNNIHKNKFITPKDLTIVTCRNLGTMEDRIIDSLSGYEHKSILECNLEYLGINDLVVLTDNRLPWRNTFKIEMIYNYIQSGKCTTKYIMYCDAIDVIFIDDPNRVIDIFKAHECKMLFMSTPAKHGYALMPQIKQWADKLSTRYLNSGVWIGETNFVYDVFHEACNYITPHGATMDKLSEYWNSKPDNFPIGSDDQDIFRYIQPKFYPNLKVDYENKMAYRN